MASGRNQLLLTRGGCGASSSFKTAATVRNLAKSELGSVIFGCTNKTMTECMLKQLFGLPALHMTYVQNIKPGLPLFLFSYTDRKLHGIFEAASHGQMNINPYGWTADGSHRTQYPAQVQVRVQLHCQPLSEDQFKPVIADNYYSTRHFYFELDNFQTGKLIALLASAAVTPIPSVPQNLVMWRTNFQHFPSPHVKNVEIVSTSIESSFDEYDGFAHDMNKKEKQPYDVEMIPNELNELAQTRGYQEVPSVRLVEFASSNAMHLKGNVSVGVLEGSEQKHGGSLSSASECQSVIAQLIQGIEELKASEENQSQRICHLEKNLFEAGREIQQLKHRCLMLESMSDPPMVPADDKMIDKSEELCLDPTVKIFLLGGYNGEKWLPSLDSYYPSQNIVKSLSSTVVSRSHASVAWLNDELYAFGGAAGELWYDTVESYSIASDQWVMRPSMGKKRGNLAGASLNGKLFAIGGGNGTETFSDVEMLDLDLGRWISTRSMLEQRFGLASVELNGALYVSGGYDGSAYLKSAERFDPREYSWHKIPSMLMRRGCHSMVALNEKVYALGGCNEHETLSSVEVFDPRLDSWIRERPMCRSRAYAGAAVVKDTIYAVGGLGDKYDIADTVECYMEGQGWREITSPIGQRCYLSAIVMH